MKKFTLTSLGSIMHAKCQLLHILLQDLFKFSTTVARVYITIELSYNKGPNSILSYKGYTQLHDHREEPGNREVLGANIGQAVAVWTLLI